VEKPTPFGHEISKQGVLIPKICATPKEKNPKKKECRRVKRPAATIQACHTR